MKRVVLAIGIALMMVVSSSCNKDLSDNGGISTLEGHYVCQKVEISFNSGEEKTITDKDSWVRKDEYSLFEACDYILFEYELNFKNGRYKYKNDYTYSLMDGGSYSVKNGVLSLGFLGMEAATYKIVSNSGSTLVLEATEDYIILANNANRLYGASRSIVKTTATYTLQESYDDNYIVGRWAERHHYGTDIPNIDDFDNEVYAYWEFTKDGRCIEYELVSDGDLYATYENGTLTTPAGAKWEVFESASYLFSADRFNYGPVSFPVTIVDDNSFIFIDSPWWVYLLSRITKFN